MINGERAPDSVQEALERFEKMSPAYKKMGEDLISGSIGSLTDAAKHIATISAGMQPVYLGLLKLYRDCKDPGQVVPGHWVWIPCFSWMVSLFLCGYVIFPRLAKIDASRAIEVKKFIESRARHGYCAAVGAFGMMLLGIVCAIYFVTKTIP